MKIAIVGATGAVGRMMIRNLAEMKIEISTLDLYASARSAGKTLYYVDDALLVEELTRDSFAKGYDYVLFSAGAGVSRSFAPFALQHARAVIDNSSAFRMEPDIPLVVPEINGALLTGYNGIIANPNCSTIQMVLPLAVLDRMYGIRKVIVSTYQAVSGTGQQGLDALYQQRNGSSEMGVYPAIIDMNVIPQIGGLQDNGYSAEEEKMYQETQKILDNYQLALSATCVRVPVRFGHCISVYVECEREVDLNDASTALAHSDAIRYSANTYTTPLDLGNSNDSHVSRLRFGTDKHSLTFWNVANNLRLGAATNAIKIMLAHAAENTKS
ncbi:MAG: aspartate-semialdehyde dehydrogenase [Candidatus Cloacimonetes bacterium]|nr:aspartate-semialdehyde dehydrogenase [Candidatus Cloacimonadota bacterium]